MKVLKIIGGVILGVLVLMFIGSFFISSNFRASHTQVIKASPSEVYEQLNTLENWKNWSYWSLLDPDSKLTYNDTKSGPGASYSWKSEKREVGSGTLTITGVEPDHYIFYTLDFGDQGKAVGEYIINPAEGGSEVICGFNSETNGFVEKWMSRLMGLPMMKKAFKATMDNLEKYIAEHPAPPPTPEPPSTNTTTAKPI